MQRFWDKVQKTTGCWEWTASKRKGYGCFTLNKRDCSAHRVAYELCVGPIPEGIKVCHSCDNKGCVNPKHLFLGTQKENIADCVKKKRHLHHEMHPLSKLTEKEVLHIRLLQGQLSCRKIAKLFGMSAAQIHNIIKRKSWK